MYTRRIQGLLYRVSVSVSACALAFLLAACGDDKDDEDSSGEAPDFQTACESYCDAQAGSGCELAQDAETCKTSCPFQAEQFLGLCADELAFSFECQAAGEIECIMGFPVSNEPSCISEALDLSRCVQGVSCRAYCAAAVPAGCGGASEDACVSECESERETLDETSGCGFEYDRLLECWGGGVTCQDGQASAAGCEQQVLDVADCKTWDDGLCASYCWASERFGCGDGCLADCESKVADASCGRDYEDVLSCYLRGYDTPSCGPTGVVVATGCESDLEDYEMCLTGP